MIESQAESATRAWSVPQCPFTIEYSLRALDDIRLAVMDAFFSLPRGGAEIGGVLLGKHAAGRLSILDYLALECEHAFGPSFNLSPPDEKRLTELLAQARDGQLEVVGWYHSHTRSEIFLSDTDQAVHARFFPEPWQVALVLKPHTFQPMRCGFFFRKPDNTMDCAATLQEFTLDPQPMRTIPAADGGRPAPHDRRGERRMPKEPSGDIIEIAALKEDGSGAAAAQAIAAPEPEPSTGPAAAVETPSEPPQEAAPPVELPAPVFAHIEHRTGVWWKTLLTVALGVGIGAAAFQTRRLWVPHTVSFLEGSVESAAPADVGLAATDSGTGQLQIRWDVHSRPVLEARGATLTITDGAALPKEVRLDRAHLLGGTFSYSRQGEEVDVAMSLDEPGGRQVKDVTGFIGRSPEPPPPPPKTVVDPALTAENARLKTQLAAESEHVKRLQKALTDAQKEIQQQARKRLGTQVPDK